MIKTYIAACTLLATAATFQPRQCLAAEQHWNPKAGDLCAEYVMKNSKGDRPITPIRDPAIAKYVAAYNAAGNIHDQGQVALFWLGFYCEGHASRKLGDISMEEVIADGRATLLPATKQFSETPASDWYTWTGQLEIAKREKIQRWMTECTDQCGKDDPACAQSCSHTLSSWVLCSNGLRRACDERDRGLAEVRGGREARAFACAC